MFFLHQKSWVWVKTGLDLFPLPSTKTNIESGKWVQYKPIATFTFDSPIEFVVPGSGEEYIDLSQTMLEITLSIVKLPGKVITNDDKVKLVAPINNWLHSLFIQIDMCIN